MKIKILIACMFFACVALAQEPIDLTKLYNKQWLMEESKIIRPSNPGKDVIIYSRNNTSYMDLHRMQIYFNQDGTSGGIDADGNSYSNTWKFEGQKSIWLKDDPKPAEITKLTDTELILQIPQTYKSPYTGEEEYIITQDKFSTAGALPVTLTSFTAQKLDNKNILLLWRTTKEIDFAYFVIEHSMNVKSFEPIGKVMTDLKNINGQNYSFTHLIADQANIHYYRLKMVNNDKSFEYSSIKSVSTSNSRLKVFPNPTRDEFKIEAPEWENVQSISLLSALGKKVYQSDSTAEKSIGIKNLPNGVYTLIIEYKSGQLDGTRIVKE